MKFDLIVGNPPYQAPQQNKTSEKGKRGGGTTLWNKIVEKSIAILKDGGFLGLIHPPNWRMKDSGKADCIKEYQILYLDINGVKEGFETFGAGTRFDWYILEKKSPYKETKVNDLLGKESSIKINPNVVIPNFNLELYKSLENISDKFCQAFLTSDCDYRKPHVSFKKSKKNKYPVVNVVNKKGETSYLYSSKKFDYFNKPKVIFGRYETSTAIYSKEELGCSPGCIYIFVDTDQEGQDLKDLINSDFGKTFENMFILTTARRNKKIYKYLPKLSVNKIIDYLRKNNIKYNIETDNNI